MIPHGTHDPPRYSWSPTVLNTHYTGWLLENQKLMHLDHFGSVASIEERTCMGWDLKLSVLRQLPPTAWTEILCCWSNCLGLNGHAEEFRTRYLRFQELVNVNYEQISFLRLLGSNWNLFWRMYKTNQSYKRLKQLSALPMAARWRPARWGSKWATTATASDSQSRQCRNTTLSHPLLSPGRNTHISHPVGFEESSSDPPQK